jgi:transposase
MAEAYSRHDISDGTWELPRTHLKGGKGTWGGNARDNRKFINGVLWVLRTGAPLTVR